jgi:predicted CoA-binding protein
MDEKLVGEFLDRRNVCAVVGFSKDTRKFGQVYKDLRNAGFDVYPVNPNVQEVLGTKCYSDLESSPKRPHVVYLIVHQM